MMYRRGEAMCYLSCSSLVTLPHLNDPLLPPGSCRNSECWCFVFISLLSFILQINCSTLLRPFHAHTHKHTQLAHKKLCILFDILSPLIITFLPRVSFSLSVLAVIRERLLQSSEQRILLFFSSLVQLRCSGHFVHRFLCKWLSLIHALLVASEGDLLYYCFAIWYRPQGTWGDDEGSATISTGYLLSTLHNGDIRTNRRKKVTVFFLFSRVSYSIFDMLLMNFSMESRTPAAASTVHGVCFGQAGWSTKVMNHIDNLLRRVYGGGV